MRNSLVLAVLVGLIFLSCVREDLTHLEGDVPEDRGVSHYISDVPFFPQSKYQCGPASLASVLNYYEYRVTPEEIAKAIYRKQLRGTLSMDLLLFVQGMGFDAMAYRGNLTDLKDHIASDRPLIVFQDLGYPLLPIRHFSVVIGYDETKNILILHSGKRANKATPYKGFLRSWVKMDNWTLLILPKRGAGN
jgi:ABC-type bacteriocin/lantibiotic exporter with double-glycine peptidase domain